MFETAILFMLFYITMAINVAKIYYEYNKKRYESLAFAALQYDVKSFFVGLFWLPLLFHFPVKLFVVLLLKLNEEFEKI